MGARPLVINFALMKPISQRSEKLQPSETVAVNTLAKQLIADGRPVINLTAGEPEHTSPESANAAGIQAIQNHLTKYGAPAGEGFLREAICRKLKTDNKLDYQPDQITVTSGAKQAIFSALLTLVDAGDEVIIPAPYWVTYPQLVRLLGATPVIAQTFPETHFKLSAKMLKAQITPKTKLVILNTPNNPTGAMYTQEELSEVMDVICENDLYVLSDEIYDQITFDSYCHTSPAAINDNGYSRTIVINGVSKTFAMTGWRIGYAACAHNLASKLAAIQSQTSLHPSMPAQYAASEALYSGHSTKLQILNTLTKNRESTIAYLRQINGLKFLNPQGAFYFFLDIRPWLRKKDMTRSSDFCRFLLRNHNVATVPGAAFGQEGFLRISITTTPKQLELGLQKLAQALR